jgi:hypothetical protein
MSVPAVLQEAIGDEAIADTLKLGGEDLLVFTPSRCICYRAEGLLSDESVSKFRYDITGLSIDVGRRSTDLVFDYGHEGTEQLGVPNDQAEAAIQTFLTFTLRSSDAIEDDESIGEVFRIDELALLLTERRYVKHVGTAVWESDAELVAYRDIWNVELEQGSVGAQVVVRTMDGVDRIKASSADAEGIYASLSDAVCNAHGVDTLDDIDPPEEPADGSGTAAPSTEDDDPSLPPLRGTSADGGTTSGRSLGSSQSAGERPADDDARAVARRQSASTGGADGAKGGGDASDPVDLAPIQERLDDIEEAVEETNERLDEHREAFEQLVDELRRGR